jgi:trimeric autotransporter adhesin
MERLTLDVVDIDGAVDMATTLAVAGNVDFNGDLDVDGTTNLDVVDVDGAVNFAADVTFADGANIITASAGTSNFRAGVNAGNSITSGGNFNTVVGDEAGTAITTGDNNVALGYKALFTEDTGQRSVAIGDFALTVQNNDDSNYNTAVGYAAGTAVTTGVQNTFIGGLAGNAITTAPSNTAVGYSALLSNSTGGGNTAVGYEALRNSTAASNTAVGTYSLYTNTSGTYNTAIGVDIPGTALGALGNNTTGSNNTAVGTAALAATTTGDKNVALGDSAGYSNTTGTGNVFLGNGAGYNTTGSGNTFVGGSTSGLYYPAGYLVTSGANNTIIGGYNGNEGSLDIRTSSNNIVLSDGDGNPRVHITSSGSMRQLANAGVVGLALAQATTSDSDNAIRYHRNSDITHSGDVRFVVFSSGNVQNTNNSYAGISDEKLKDNITDATPKLEKLKQVKVRSYNFKDEPDFKQIGVVAQELETVFPNLVETIDDQDMGLTKSVKYSVFVPILIKAIQEQQTIIESLTARITTLEG